ncbi:MAG: hypothetical protein Q3976_09755 [Corynebacterium sp.]|nr:hypothetical protein [Corynebacterium sp.]
MRSENKPPRLPEVYYKRRRAAALCVLLVLLLVLVFTLSRCGGSSEETPEVAATATTSTASSSATETTTSEESTTSSSEESSTESSSSTSAEAAPEAICDPATLQLVASSSASTYSGVQQPTFYVTVRNPTDVDCSLNLGDLPLSFQVYDLVTDTRIWADTDCNEPVAQELISLEAGQERYYQAIWSRTTSAAGACTAREAAPAGAYYLRVALGENVSAPHTFNLA